jgi:hypothetical protein
VVQEVKNDAQVSNVSPPLGDVTNPSNNTDLRFRPVASFSEKIAAQNRVKEMINPYPNPRWYFLFRLIEAESVSVCFPTNSWSFSSDFTNSCHAF